MTERTCECGCGRAFEPRIPTQRFFEDACRIATYNRENRSHKPKSHVPWAPKDVTCPCGCGVTFTQHSPRHCYATASCRYRHRDATDPKRIANNRIRNRRWQDSRKENREERPWLLGPPPFAEYLPGGAFTLSFAPALRWPLELRNARLLHGVMTELTAIPHHETMPMFALIPMENSRVKWSVWIADEAVARRLSGNSWPSMIADQSVLVHCGPFTQLRSPRVAKRGHQKVRVELLTPLTIRSMGGAITHVNPTEENLCSTLSSWLPRRLGLDYLRIRFRLLENHTDSVRTDLGGKYGVVLGCGGYFVADVNAPCRWLLECAARGLGMGGRTAFGFGRIRVSDVADEKARAA